MLVSLPTDSERSRREMSDTVFVRGHVSPGYESAREELRRALLAGPRDAEAQACATVHGVKVLDCWGSSNPSSELDGKTRFPSRMLGRALTALTAAVLVDQGILTYDEPRSNANLGDILSDKDKEKDVAEIVRRADWKERKMEDVCREDVVRKAYSDASLEAKEGQSMLAWSSARGLCSLAKATFPHEDLNREGLIGEKTFRRLSDFESKALAKDSQDDTFR